MAIPKPKPSLSKELFLNERIDGREIGDVMNDEEGMANMRNLGQNMAWLINNLKKATERN